MSLLHLPPELLLIIATDLPTRDLNALHQSHTTLSHLLTPLLHTHALQPIHGHSPLSFAASHGYPSLAKIALSYLHPINAQDPTTLKTALHHAAHAGDAPMVQLLLDHGADINLHSYAATTTLHWATLSSSVSTLELLLEHGADILAADNAGRTPLRCALPMSSEAAITFLLDRGGGGDWTTRARGMEATLLHAACMFGDSRAWVVELLVRRGAGLEDVDKMQGGTPLHWAAREGGVGVVRVLLKGGARVEATDWGGRRPVEWARAVEMEPRLRKALFVKAFGRGVVGRGEVVRLLAEYGARVEDVDGG